MVPILAEAFEFRRISPILAVPAGANFVHFAAQQISVQLSVGQIHKSLNLRGFADEILVEAAIAAGATIGRGLPFMVVCARLIEALDGS